MREERISLFRGDCPMITGILGDRFSPQFEDSPALGRHLRGVGVGSGGVEGGIPRVYI